jgi:hypothetical protein
MDFIFSIFEFVTLAAGPFCVFAGMGTGTQSGKLKFRSIINGDSSISITQDSTSLIVSSNKTTLSAPINKVLWGTGTSTSYGFLEVDTNSTMLIGAEMIESDSVGVANSQNSMMINTWKTCIESSQSSNHISDIKSYMLSGIAFGNIIGGCYNNMKYSYSTSVINSVLTCTYQNNYGTILSSNCTCLKYTDQSSIISSTYLSFIDGVTNSSKSRNISLISSRKSKIIGPEICNSTIISSVCSCVYHYNPLGTLNSNNSIISSCSSLIAGGQTSGGITLGSKGSTILSGSNNIICDGCFSSIISGSCNSICIYKYGGSLYTTCSSYNTIISGYCNRIYTIVNTEQGGDIYGISIIGSKKSVVSDNSSKASALINTENASITNSNYSVNISSKYSSVSAGNNSSILSDSGVSGNPTLISGDNSVLLVGKKNRLVSDSSAIVGSYYSRICQSKYSAIVSGLCNNICSSAGKSVIISGCCNIVRSESSVIISGIKNCVCSSENGTILSGCSNRIISGSNNSSIIAGAGNKIESGISSIMLGGCANAILATQSSVLGGFNNIICANRSSIIGSCNISLTGSNTTFVSNFIFDLNSYIGPEPTPHCGKTSLFNPATTPFKIRKGFITTT